MRFSLLLLLVLLLSKAQQAQEPGNISLNKREQDTPSKRVISILKTDPNLELPEHQLEKGDIQEFKHFVEEEQKAPFKQGEVFYKGRYTAYVRGVMEEIVKANSPEKDYQVFISKDPTANAKALPGGILLLNVGLIKQMENEAQLAYIICHEMAHIQKHHLFKIYKKTVSAKEKEMNTAFSDRGFRQLKYSREFESEADAVGLQLYNNTDYKLKEATSALARLRDTNTYNFQSINITRTLPLDSTEVKKDSGLIAEIKEEQEELLIREEEFGDQFTSHPDLNKRIKALAEIIGEMNNSGSNEIYIHGNPQRYEGLRAAARFESVEAYYQNAKYGPSLFLALQLLKQHAGNQFLQAAVLKNLFWLSRFKELQNLDEVVSHKGWEESEAYLNFYAKLSSIGLKPFKQMAYDYGDQLTDKNETIQFYTALAAREYLGKSLGKNKLNAFQNEYPNSQFQNYVQYHLD